MADFAGEKLRGREVEVMEPSRSAARHLQQVEIPLDLDDPHRAAIEDNQSRKG